MADPRASYPDDGTFGRRIRQRRDEKIAVARRVVQDFLGPGQSAFVSDGSSTFYVALELYERGHQVEIDTNSLPVAHEFPLWVYDPDDPDGQPRLADTRVHMAGGLVDRDLEMVSGGPTYEFVERSASIVEYTVLSARAIFADQGPVGEEGHSLRVKQSALREAQHVIWAIDHDKLAQDWHDALPKVYSVDKAWISSIDKSNTYIVTSRHPDVVYPEEVERHPPAHPRTPKDRFLHNRYSLKSRMNRRFIEVEAPPVPPPDAAAGPVPA